MDSLLDRETALMAIARFWGRIFLVLVFIIGIGKGAEATVQSHLATRSYRVGEYGWPYFLIFYCFPFLLTILVGALLDPVGWYAKRTYDKQVKTVSPRNSLGRFG